MAALTPKVPVEYQRYVAATVDQAIEAEKPCQHALEMVEVAVRGDGPPIKGLMDTKPKRVKL